MDQRSYFSFFLLLGFIAFSSAIHRHRRDGVSSTQRLNDVVDEHVNRLMLLRQSNWGWWNTPSVTIALQLTEQKSFFGRNRSVEAMKQKFLNQSGSFSTGKLALYTMASLSVCENPRNFTGTNLIETLQDRLNSASLDADGVSWYSHALAVQALCLSNVTVGKRKVREILSNQNPDGGFGDSHSLDTTAQFIIALKCVAEQPHHSKSHISSKIERSIRRASKYLKSKIEHRLDLLWIGNKYSTPISLSALRAVNKSLHLRKEKKVVDSLVSCDPDTDPEAAVAQRLMTLRNATVLQLQSWSCSPVVAPIPDGYQPGVVSQSASSDDDEDYFFVIPIDVRLTVETGSSNFSILVTDVTKDDTLLETMERASSETNFEFTVRNTQWGPFVVSVNGLQAQPSMNQYWSLIDAKTNQYLPVGVNQYLPSDGDHILFRMVTY